MKTNRPVVLEFGRRACCFNKGRLFADDFPNRSCVLVGFAINLGTGYSASCVVAHKFVNDRRLDRRSYRSAINRAPACLSLGNFHPKRKEVMTNPRSCDQSSLRTPAAQAA
jgi:hypothetical protein